MIKKLLKKVWIELSNHNRYKMIASVSCVALFFYCNGCAIKCNSILHPGTKITGEELQMEVDTFFSRAEIEANSIARQQLMRDYLWNSAIATLSTGTFNWLNFFTGAGTLIGFGAFADNMRYRIKFPKPPA